MNSVTATADFLSGQLAQTGRFTIMSPGGGKSLPLVAFRLKDKVHYDEVSFEFQSDREYFAYMFPACL